MVYPYFPVSAEEVSRLPLRERVGLNFQSQSALEALEKIASAEAFGVRQIWLTSGSVQGCETLTFYGAAAARTSNIRLGTAIVQVYTRHPLTLAQQALALDDLAPGRLRLGLGASHPHIVVGQLGLSHERPISYLSEYLEVVRALLWEGGVRHGGRHFRVEAKLKRSAKIPLLLAALRSGSFRVAGRIADGAISWMCPLEYLKAKAAPALKEGAESAGRSRPPLVAHVLVSLNTDYGAVHAAAKKAVEYYGGAPFYQRMFEEAGYPIAERRDSVDELADALVFYGSAERVREKILEALSKSVDELLLTQLVTAEPDQEWLKLSRLVGTLY